MYWKFETEAEATLFRQIQDEQLCDYAECTEANPATCNCLAELERRLAHPSIPAPTGLIE